VEANVSFGMCCTPIASAAASRMGETRELAAVTRRRAKKPAKAAPRWVLLEPLSVPLVVLGCCDVGEGGEEGVLFTEWKRDRRECISVNTRPVVEGLKPCKGESAGDCCCLDEVLVEVFAEVFAEVLAVCC